MKRLLLLLLSAFIFSGVSAQDHQVTRKPTNPQQTTAKPARKPSSKSATKPVGKPAQNPQSQPKTTSKKNPNAALCPDGNHPHAIDLGLPSGTKWSCCNVGADKPEGYGGYYAWGETETKGSYSESTYKYYQNGDYVSLGNDVAGTKYDVAHVKWGGSWVMPTKDQQDELRANCTYTWTTLNGVKGGRFTSKKNGASIFLPAAGYRWGGGLYGAGSYGYYWSSTQDPSYTSDAYYLYGYSGKADWYIFDRNKGRTVRPVSR